MENNVFSRIKTFAGLAAYRCPDVVGRTDWYLGCVDCSNQENCDCGKRAVELLETKTTTGKRGGHNSYNTLLTDEAKYNFENALKSGKPINWVITTFGSTKDAAYERIRKWCKNYPDIVKKYPNVEIDGAFKKSIKDIDSNARVLWVRKRVEEVFANPDPISFIMENDGLSALKARNKLYRWAHTYPDLDKKLHITEYIKSISISQYKEAISKTMFKSKNEPITEEVSVEDFLKEQIPEKEFETFPCLKDDLLLMSIKKKQEEFRKEIADLQNQIDFIQNKIEVLNKTYYILTEKIPE